VLGSNSHENSIPKFLSGSFIKLIAATCQQFLEIWMPNKLYILNISNVCHWQLVDCNASLLDVLSNQPV
jgi:hypothetical protein